MIEQAALDDHRLFRLGPSDDPSKADLTSGFDCVTMLLRQSLAYTEPEKRVSFKLESVLMHYACCADFTRNLTEEKRELIMRLHPHPGPATFEKLVNSEQVSSLLWKKPDRLLFARAVLRPGENWMYEDDGKEAHRSLVRVAREVGSGPLNLGQEIEKLAVVNELPDESVERLLVRPSSFIRIEYTPAADERQRLESLQTFQVENASTEQVRFVLIAAVCYRNETIPVDRIRLFTCRGVELLPHHEATYRDPDWEVGAVGHTYFLLYVQSDIPLSKITPDMRDIIAGRKPGAHTVVASDEERAECRRRMHMSLRRGRAELRRQAEQKSGVGSSLEGRL